jgi:ubiquinone/menaquinone biosynthesis C-methylase UbiE
MARAIGSLGRIYATDINPERLEELRQISASHPNIVVVEGGSVRTNLPDECCDAIFMRHVYHHVGDPAAMNRDLRRSLKRGGRLVVIDFPPESGPSAPAGRRDTKPSHGVTAMTVADELSSAGFIRVGEVLWTQRPYFAVFGVRPD